MYGNLNDLYVRDIYYVVLLLLHFKYNIKIFHFKLHERFNIFSIRTKYFLILAKYLICYVQEFYNKSNEIIWFCS